MLEGNRGLLFTDEAPSVVLEWFESFKKQDFARTGNQVDETFELPAGASPFFPAPLLFPSFRFDLPIPPLSPFGPPPLSLSLAPG